MSFFFLFLVELEGVFYTRRGVRTSQLMMVFLSRNLHEAVTKAETFQFKHFPASGSEKFCSILDEEVGLNLD